MDLSDKRCTPCEGGAKLTPAAADALLIQCPGWQRDGDWIHLAPIMKNFVRCIDLIRDVADLAEDEGHHPDLHLTGYRHLKISLQTHAVGGLSENDFILAAKISTLVAATERAQ